MAVKKKAKEEGPLTKATISKQQLFANRCRYCGTLIDMVPAEKHTRYTSCETCNQKRKKKITRHLDQYQQNRHTSGEEILMKFNQAAKKAKCRDCGYPTSRCVCIKCQVCGEANSRCICELRCPNCPNQIKNCTCTNWAASVSGDIDDDEPPEEGDDQYGEE